MEEKQKKQKLTPFEREIKAHWREHRPRMNRGLKRAGELDQAVSNAAKPTNEAYLRLREQGISHDQAWELIREEWAFIPDEETMPVLGRGRRDGY